MSSARKRLLVIGAIIVAAALAIGGFIYSEVRSHLDTKHYTAQFKSAAGIFEDNLITVLGMPVGRVSKVTPKQGYVEVEFTVDGDVKVPKEVKAVALQTAILTDRQIELQPVYREGEELPSGSTIGLGQTVVPVEFDAVLDTLDTGLKSIPRDDLKTAVDESYTAFGGLGPEISRFVKGSTALATDARKNLDQLTGLVDQSKPVLDSQADTSGAIQQWAAHLDSITGQLQQQDQAVAGVINKGAPAADEVRALFDRLQPTLPIVLANLVSLGEVAITYQPNLEQLLVLLPQGAAVTSAIGVANRHTRQDYRGAYLSFNLNLNLPPPCVTGFLPAQQKRVPSDVDAPERAAGDLYCRIPQDSTFNVRGARNIPCETVPGKRAATVKLCESNEFYQPLNDGYNWKGDPNATLSGQGIPDLGPGTRPAPEQGQAAPPPTAIAAAEYDPRTGTYVGPDGQVYTQANLATRAQGEQTWQTMLLPPKMN